MAVIDYVVCEMPLPEPAPPPGTELQSRDFPDPLFEHYTIRADGRLFVRSWEAKAGRGREFGGDIEFPYHGDVQLSAWEGEWTAWARFTNGVCTLVWTPPAHDLGEKSPAERTLDRLRAMRAASSGLA